MSIALEIPRRQIISTKDEVQWNAVVARDRKYDDKFYYSVATTGVYCRPSCVAIFGAMLQFAVGRGLLAINPGRISGIRWQV